jgi:hypothetical protein
MEENKVVIGALLFIILIIGANFVMYGIVRGAANSKGKDFWETISKSMTTPMKKNDEMDELRRKMEELKKDGKENEGTTRS